MADADGDRSGPIPRTVFRGMAFPPSLSRETVESATTLKPKPQDVVVAAYPKSGSVWTKVLVWQILSGGAPMLDMAALRRSACPWLEEAGAAGLRERNEKVVMMTHLPGNMLAFNADTKYIYVSRNPWDVCVSYYHFKKLRFEGVPSADAMTFDDFFERFVRGDVWYGDYFDHYLSWQSFAGRPNVLTLHYETMVGDVSGCVFRVAQFLGPHYAAVLRNDRETLEALLRKTSLDSMRKSNSSRDGDARYFRKGTVGDWKNHMSVEQKRRIDRLVVEKLKDTDAPDRWKMFLNDSRF